MLSMIGTTPKLALLVIALTLWTALEPIPARARDAGLRKLFPDPIAGGWAPEFVAAAEDAAVAAKPGTRARPGGDVRTRERRLAAPGIHPQRRLTQSSGGNLAQRVSNLTELDMAVATLQSGDSTHLMLLTSVQFIYTEEPQAQLLVPDGAQLTLECESSVMVLDVFSGRRFFQLEAGSTLEIVTCSVAPLPLGELTSFGVAPLRANAWGRDAQLRLVDSILAFNCELMNAAAFSALKLLVEEQPEGLLEYSFQTGAQKATAVVSQLSMQPFWGLKTAQQERFSAVNTSFVCDEAAGVSAAVSDSGQLWNGLHEFVRRNSDLMRAIARDEADGADESAFALPAHVPIVGTIQLNSSAQQNWTAANFILRRPLVLDGANAHSNAHSVLDLQRAASIFAFVHTLPANPDRPEQEAVLRLRDLTVVNLPLGPRFHPHVPDLHAFTWHLWLAGAEYSDRIKSSVLSCTNCRLIVECSEVVALRNLLTTLHTHLGTWVGDDHRRGSVEADNMAIHFKLRSSEAILLSFMRIPGLHLEDTWVTCTGQGSNLLRPLSVSRNFSAVADVIVANASPVPPAPAPPDNHPGRVALFAMLSAATAVLMIGMLVVVKQRCDRKWNPPVKDTRTFSMMHSFSHSMQALSTPVADHSTPIKRMHTHSHPVESSPQAARVSSHFSPLFEGPSSLAMEEASVATFATGSQNHSSSPLMGLITSNSLNTLSDGRVPPAAAATASTAPIGHVSTASSPVAFLRPPATARTHSSADTAVAAVYSGRTPGSAASVVSGTSASSGEGVAAQLRGCVPRAAYMDDINSTVSVQLPAGQTDGSSSLPEGNTAALGTFADVTLGDTELIGFNQALFAAGSHSSKMSGSICAPRPEGLNTDASSRGFVDALSHSMSLKGSIGTSGSRSSTTLTASTSGSRNEFTKRHFHLDVVGEDPVDDSGVIL